MDRFRRQIGMGGQKCFERPAPVQVLQEPADRDPRPDRDASPDAIRLPTRMNVPT